MQAPSLNRESAGQFKMFSLASARKACAFIIEQLEKIKFLILKIITQKYFLNF